MPSKSLFASFTEQLIKEGYSEEAADELWKWYDPSKKKGAASF